MIVRQIVTEYDDILGLVARRAAPPDLLASASRPVRWRCRTEQENCRMRSEPLLSVRRPTPLGVVAARTVE